MHSARDNVQFKINDSNSEMCRFKLRTSQRFMQAAQGGITWRNLEEVHIQQ